MQNENTNSPKRLYRSRREKMIAGICSGLAEFLNIDPSIVRLVWIIIIFLGGLGIVLYLICWFIIPSNPQHIILENLSATKPPPEEFSPKHIYRSRRGKMIAGVCGGIAEYISIDPTIVRLAWVLLTLIYGSGIFLYLIGWIIIPRNPNHIMAEYVPPPPPPQSSSQSGGTMVMGIVMVTIGSAFILESFMEYAWSTFCNIWSMSVFALVLTIFGFILLFRKAYQ